MRTLINIFILFLTVNFSVSLCLGQNISRKPVHNNKIAVQINKRILPSGFMAGLQVQTNHRRNNDKSVRGFSYHIDTALVYSNTTNPQRYIYFYDSDGNRILTYSELTTNGQWNYVSKDTATYDSVGNRLTSLSKIRIDGVWVNASRSVSTYTVNHNVVTKVGKIWANNKWIYTDSSYYTYDYNGNKVASFHASRINSVWVNTSFDLYSYDSVGNQTLFLNEQWKDSLWVDNQRVIYVYDSASNLVSGLVQNWGDTTWINLYRENYSYDSARNRLSYTGEIWNDSLWINNQYYAYTYYKFGQVKTGIGKNWNDSVWANSEKGQYTYDTYGGIESYLYQQWENNSIWGNVSLAQYNYDSVGNAYVGNYYAWDSLDRNWLQNKDGLFQIYFNYGSEKAFYTGYQVAIKYNAPLSTGVNDGIKDIVSQYTLAPNPAMDYTTVSIGMKAREQVSMSLYNITGKKISNLFQGVLSRGVHRFYVPTAQLPSGLYFVSFLSARQAQTIKLIVKK
jgi:hypothetical protein